MNLRITPQDEHSTFREVKEVLITKDTIEGQVLLQWSNYFNLKLISISV